MFFSEVTFLLRRLDFCCDNFNFFLSDSICAFFFLAPAAVHVVNVSIAF